MVSLLHQKRIEMRRCDDTLELLVRRMSEADIAHHMAVCQKQHDERAEVRKAAAKRAAITRRFRLAQMSLFENKN